jgi:hypothetical protein
MYSFQMEMFIDNSMKRLQFRNLLFSRIKVIEKFLRVKVKLAILKSSTFDETI